MKYTIPNIGPAMRKARARLGLTQAQLGGAAAVPQARISAAENGGDLRVSTLQAIAGALDLKLMLVPRKAEPLIRSVIDSLP